MEVCLYMSVPYGEIFIELKTLEDLSKDKNPFLPNDIKLFHNKFLWKMKIINILESPFHLWKKWGFKNLIYDLLTALPFKGYLDHINIDEHALRNWFTLHKVFSEWYKNVSSLFDDTFLYHSEKGKQLCSKRAVFQFQEQKDILQGWRIAQQNRFQNIQILFQGLCPRSFLQELMPQDLGAI